MLDKKNLIAEMISPPLFREGEIFYEMLRKSNKAMLQEINKYKNIQNEYREYIELWVHEIKSPISSINLIGLNNKNEIITSMIEEVDKVENYIEQVLYYSRSNNVEKDYVIRLANLKDICFDVLKSKSKDFIKNKVVIETVDLESKVLTDKKWIKFILNQIFSNSLLNKYYYEMSGGEKQRVAAARALVIAVCIFYIFNSISSQKKILDLSSADKIMFDNLSLINGAMSIFVSIVFGFLIIYANNFLN
ncbi:MAG: hypothetical protein ABF289_17800 [Clostridiales bacterium]